MTKQESIKELEHDKEKLEAENQRLKVELTRGHKKPAGGFWRGLAIGVCLLLAMVSLIAGNVLFWAGNTLVNTDRYVKTAQPILQDTAVQTAIANYTTTKIFAQVDVTGTIQQTLPARAAFLAPALTTQLQKTTDATLRTALASNRFQALWANTNRTAHDKLINSIKHSKGDGVVNLQDLYSTLSQNLRGTKLSFLVGKQLPSNVGSITVINAPWIPKVRFVVNSVGWLKPVSLLLIAVFSAAAIWLARRRRMAVILLGGFTSLSMIATLVAIQVVKHTVVSQAAPAYQTAASHAANIIVQPLVVTTISILLIGIIVKIVAWVTSPYKYAGCTRRLTAQWLTTPIHNLIWRRESSTTNWFKANKTAIEWTIVAITAAVTLFTELSPKEVIWRALLILFTVLVIETLAAPHSRGKR
jgi:multisubunit Na+/H+ antiporter MnhC subunit